MKFTSAKGQVCELMLIKTVMLDSEQVGGSPIGHARKLLWFFFDMWGGAGKLGPALVFWN